LAEAARLAQQRETARSEITRVMGVIRAFALKAGELTNLGEDVFHLTIDELLAVLAGDTAICHYLPNRKATYERYRALPPYPPVISGRFDPFQWAADPNRRSDVYDAHVALPLAVTNVIQGFAGAAGLVEGIVRRIDRIEDSYLLRAGEILLTTTTNVGWTPLFPRAAAIITDVGAPLSHAAIVARELGIPAVVGCNEATLRLKTGDRVRVNGGQGFVEIL
jgi:pyruvate,water dikinase